MTDGDNGTGTDTLVVVVGGSMPVANEDTFATISGLSRGITAADLLANDGYREGQTPVVAIVAEPEHGTLTATGNGAWTYTPVSGFVGWDTFRYTITDSHGSSAPATVRIQVAEALPPHVLAVNAALLPPPEELAGRSWQFAYSSLQDALDQAEQRNTDADPENDITEIWVVGGTYVPSRRPSDRLFVSWSFGLLSHVAIVGGFAGVESFPHERLLDADGWPVYETVLSGSLLYDPDDYPNAYGNWRDNAWTVVWANDVQDAVLDGVTITRAECWDDWYSAPKDGSCGGLFTRSSTLTLRNVRILENYVQGYGGGIYQEGGVLRLERVWIEDNFAVLGGGGLWQAGGELQVTDSVFIYNDGNQRGGAIYQQAGIARLTNVTFNSNWALQGAGMYAAGGTSRLTNVTFTGGSASQGVGIYVSGSSPSDLPSVTVINGVFMDNTRSYGDQIGGVLYNAGGVLTVHNSTVTANHGGGTTGYGAIGVYSAPAAHVTTKLLNTVVAGNTSSLPQYGDVGGEFSAASAANLIGILDPAQTTGLAHGVNGNLAGSSSQPLDAQLDGVRPAATSPAVGAGDVSRLPADKDDLDGDGNTSEPLPLDAEGRVRVSGGLLTIGAYQHAAPVLDAGGPYEVDEGGSVELAAWASFDPRVEPGSSPVQYRWEWDGAFQTTATWTFSAAELDGPQQRTVHLVAWNEFGVKASHWATIVIRNVAPQVHAGSDLFGVPAGEPIAFSGEFFDPGIWDTHTILWDFGDGATATDTLTPLHAYAQRGIYTVTLTVTDNDGGVGSDTLQVVVGLPPVALDDSYETDEDTTRTVVAPGVLANDLDRSGQGLMAELVEGVKHGELHLRSNGSYWYAPAENWFGTDNFTYRVFDGVFYSAPATVTITVHPVNDPPVLESIGPQSVYELELLTFTIVAYDVDSPPETLTYSAMNLPVGASFDPETQTFSWTPSRDQSPGTYYVTFLVSDGKASDAEVVAITVQSVNVAPIVVAGSDASLEEGATFTGAGYFVDPDPDTWTATVDYGDGSGLQPLALNPDKTFQLNHVYADNGTYTVTVTVMDDYDGSHSDTLTVAVVNVAPTAVIGNSGPVMEGSPVTVSLSDAFDPSGADTAAGFRYSFATSLADLATTYADAVEASSRSFTFDDNGTMTVYGRIFDKDGGFTDYQTVITVINIAPTATIGNSGPVDEGSPVTVSLSDAFDPSGADTAAGFRYSFATSLADLATTYADAVDGSSRSFTFDDNGTRTVYARIFDKDDGFADYQTVVTVLNVPPSNLLLSLSSAEIDEYGRIALSGSFVDPGALDAHTLTIDWDDGGPVEVLHLPAGVRSFSDIPHTFLMHRPHGESYTIRVTVADEVEATSATVSTIWPWWDFGDAPDSYSTLLASNGARHRYGSGLFLGATVDAEKDGRPTKDALGDDTHGIDDEDGVTFGPILRQGQMATVRVWASQSGRLDAFLDFNADGDFADAGEKIFDNVAVAAGENVLTFLVPADAASAVTYARFRLSSGGGLSFDGPAADGEVEDYRVTVGLYSVCKLLADGRYRVDVYNGTPDGAVVFAYGKQTGAWPLPHLGLTLDILDPTYFALGGTTDAAGHSAAILNIPSSLRGQTLYVQAFEQVPHPQAAPVFVIDQTPPTVTIQRAASQPTRTGQTPIHFSVTFSEPVVGFTVEDVTIGGTAPGPLTATLTQDGTSYEVVVSGMTGSGTVFINVAAGVVHDLEGNPNFAGSGAEHYVVFLANPWQNYPDPYDVSGDGVVTALDVLLVINWLNAHGFGPLPPSPTVVPAYLDVDGNGRVTPLDALLVINRLNLASQEAGEGEADTASLWTGQAALSREQKEFASTTVPVYPADMTAAIARPVVSPHGTPRPVSLAEFDRGNIRPVPRDRVRDSLHDRAWRDVATAEADIVPSDLDDILSDLAEDVLRHWTDDIRS